MPNLVISIILNVTINFVLLLKWGLYTLGLLIITLAIHSLLLAIPREGHQTLKSDELSSFCSIENILELHHFLSSLSDPYSEVGPRRPFFAMCPLSCDKNLI